MTRSIPAVLGEFEHFFSLWRRRDRGALLILTRAYRSVMGRIPKLCPEMPFLPFCCNLINKILPTLLLYTRAEVTYGANRCCCDKRSRSHQCCEGPSLPSVHSPRCLIREFYHPGSSLILPASPHICFLLLLGGRLHRKCGGRATHQ